MNYELDKEGFRVGDIDQVQGMAGGGGAGAAAVFGFDYLAETIYRELAPADFQQRTDNGTHHIT